MTSHRELMGIAHIRGPREVRGAEPVADLISWRTRDLGSRVRWIACATMERLEAACFT
jgi:hypothetical protein